MGHADSYAYGSSSYTPSKQAGASAATSSRKRKADHPPVSNGMSDKRVVIDLTADSSPKKRKQQTTDEERSLRKWRARPPQSYQEIRARALTQRMFVLDRQRDEEHSEHPIETISLAGTTGNVYTITIDKVPSCDCPHAVKGNQCKHIVYVCTEYSIFLDKL